MTWQDFAADFWFGCQDQLRAIAFYYRGFGLLVPAAAADQAAKICGEVGYAIRTA